VSLVYLCLFAGIGLLFAVMMANESTALFMPILLWVAAVFILPELTTGQNPVALLNPVMLANALPDQGPFFAAMHTVLGPFSVGQFYTKSGLSALGASSDGMAGPLSGLAGYALAVVGVCAYALQRRTGANDLSL
jgi:ABC-type transport system involved in multi-copper enzyme maturation permease subunit